MAEDQSTSTVLVAGVANLLIAVAKLVAGLTSGSAAMLSEAAHSLGDTMNQGFLMASVRRSRKPPDPQHPFGYGKERYFWSLLAAVGTFVLGAGFSAYQGIESLVGHGEAGSATWSFVVLGLSFVFEGTSFVKALVQLRGDSAAASTGAFDHLQQEADPALRAVVWEDGAALVGLLVAAAGLALDTILGVRTWDGVASLAIAVLLIAVAYGLGRQNQEYLIGKAASPELQRSVADIIAEAEGVDSVMEVMTMRLSPEEVLVAARVDLADHLSPEQIERAADEIDDAVKDRFPEVRHLFLDPTPDPTRRRPARAVTP
jgi:cation diffusion facilitator family transporter